MVAMAGAASWPVGVARRTARARSAPPAWGPMDASDEVEKPDEVMGPHVVGCAGGGR